jgi:thiosulfate/3-mercaptopyruvate sulfurtransferase
MPSLLGADNKLKSTAELQALFESAGVKKDKPIVFSCGGGVMATVLAAAANEAGYTGFKVYDGSWSEYSTKI